MNYYQRTALYIRILVFMLAMFIGVIIYGFVAYADESTANNYEEFKTCVYNAMVNRQSSVVINYNGADYQTVISNIRQDKMLNEIQNMDNINTSDDGVYLIKAAYNGYNFSYQRGNNGVSFTMNFIWDENITELNYVNNEVNRIINETGVKNMNNAYDRSIALRDYLTKNITYGKGSKNTPYTALTTKNASCHSFALLYYKLLTAADVKCYYVTGYVEGGWHAWNIVEIGGKWYNIDVTYESTFKDSQYSFKGTDSFSATHKYDAIYTSNEFLKKFNISQIDFDKNGYTGNDLINKSNSSNNICVSKDKDASVVLNNQQNNSNNQTQSNSDVNCNNTDDNNKQESINCNNKTECSNKDENSTDNININKEDNTKAINSAYDNSPKTGDVTPLTVCIILAIVSMIICTSVIIIKKKRG